MDLFIRKVLLITFFITNTTLFGFIFKEGESKTIYLNDTSKIKGCAYEKRYYENKIIKEEGCLVNGLKEGVWKVYDQFGVLSFYFTYKKGVKHGSYSSFFETGQIKVTGSYNNGSLCDTLKSYNEKGDLVSESFWIINGDGKSTMKSQIIYDSKIKQDGTIETINGKKHVWIQGQLIPMEN